MSTMKTAEEFAKENGNIVQRADGKHINAIIINLDDYKKIQLDAYRAGMTVAANICRKDGVECDEHGDTEECCASFRNEETIIAARDRKDLSL